MYTRGLLGAAERKDPQRHFGAGNECANEQGISDVSI